MAERRMWDSVTADDIPARANMVGGYIDGNYRWSVADWQRFDHAVKVRIAVFASTRDGHALDVEKGNATPAQAPSWVAQRRAAGVDPTVYCSRAAWPKLITTFHAQGVPEPHWWIADWTGLPHTLSGASAVQYANPATSGGHYDLSTVADYWPGVDPRPGNPAPTNGGPTMADKTTLTDADRRWLASEMREIVQNNARWIQSVVQNNVRLILDRFDKIDPPPKSGE